MTLLLDLKFRETGYREQTELFHHLAQRPNTRRSRAK
jgi:hypothetical protein